MAHGLSCSAACGIFPDQGSNPCPLHWQVDSQPVRHQGSPLGHFYSRWRAHRPASRPQEARCRELWLKLPCRGYLLTSFYPVPLSIRRPGSLTLPQILFLWKKPFIPSTGDCSWPLYFASGKLKSDSFLGSVYVKVPRKGVKYLTK